MKLYCFVILVFISVIFVVGEERKWGNEGIRRVNILPISKRSLNPANPASAGEVNLSTNNQEKSKPSATHAKPNNENDKAKHNEKNDGDAQPLLHDSNADNDKDTAKKLEEETQTINKVIVVLGSLGASLLLVAIAIAVLYLKVRKQQKIVKGNKLYDVTLSSSKGSSSGGENNVGNTNDNNDNNNNIGKRDDGIGVGNSSDSLCIAPLVTEKPNIPNIINNSD